MTTRTFRPYDPEELWLWLLPPSSREWLPEDHLAYFLSDLVEELNLKPILATYGGVTRGTAPYHPQLLVKVLLSAYAMGIPASRQIARKLEEDVAVRVLAANQRPDFRTLSDVRKPHLPALASLVVQVLQFCQRAGLVKRGHLALEGTNVKANASKSKAMSDGRDGDGSRAHTGGAGHGGARPTTPRPATTALQLDPSSEGPAQFHRPGAPIMPASDGKGSVAQG